MRFHYTQFSASTFGQAEMNRVVWRATGYPEPQALGFEARHCEAMVAADSGALDRLLSDALTWSHASARQVDKAIFLAELRGGHTRYLEIRRSEERVHLHGDVAVVIGVADMRASVDGVYPDSLRIRRAPLPSGAGRILSVS